MAKLKSGTRIYGNATVDSALTITSGPTLIGTGTSTGTASQPLQVTGGAYFSGSVGVGITNPQQKLDVRNGTILVVNPDASGLRVLSGAATSYTSMTIGRTAGDASISVAGGAGQWANNSSSGDLVIRTETTSTKLLFTNGANNATLAVANNNVGIGTTNPGTVSGTKLQVQDGALSVYNGPSGAITTSIQLFSSPISQSDGTGQRIEFRSDVINAYIEGVRDAAAGPSMSMRLGVYQTEAIRILSSGNVGIGTINPTSKLHVDGNSLVTGVGTFVGGINIRNTNNNGGVRINYTSGAVSENTLSIPNLIVNTGIAVTGQNQTFTGTQTFNSITASGITSFSGNTTLSGLAVNIVPTNTGSTFTIGTTLGTGNIVLGQSTRTQQTDIQAGASGVGTIKTINLGTGGLSGSFTQINIGPSAGVGTVAINAGTNVGIGTNIPTSRLHILGGTATAGTSPLEIAAGTLLTTPEADTFEYDGRLLYHTQNDLTNGNKRALIPEVQFIRNPSNVTIASTTSPGTSIFGSTARPALLSGNFYDVEMVLFLAKGASNGSITYQAALSTGNFTTMNILSSNATTNVAIGATTSPVTIFTSISINAGSQQGLTIRGIVQPASNSRLDMLLYNSAGTTTCYANSYLKVICVGTASSIGNFG